MIDEPVPPPVLLSSLPVAIFFLPFRRGKDMEVLLEKVSPGRKKSAYRLIKVPPRFFDAQEMHGNGKKNLELHDVLLNAVALFSHRTFGLSFRNAEATNPFLFLDSRTGQRHIAFGYVVKISLANEPPSSFEWKVVNNVSLYKGGSTCLQTPMRNGQPFLEMLRKGADIFTQSLIAIRGHNYFV